MDTIPQIPENLLNQMTEQQEDPNKPLFRRWHQINFCRRARALRTYNFSHNEPAFFYSVQEDSITQLKNGVQFALKNSKDQKSGNNYLFSIKTSQNGIISIDVQDTQEPARFKLSEWGPVVNYEEEFEKYEHGKVSIQKSSQNNNSVDVHFETRLCIPLGDLETEVDSSIHIENHTFNISLSPFVLTYIFNDKVMSVINSKNLLSIERQRTQNVVSNSDSTFFAKEDEDLFMEQEWKEQREGIVGGPSAVSIDISFGQCSQYYGIPQRINSYQIQNSVKYSRKDEKDTILTLEEENEPQRINTADHFCEKYPNHSTYGAVPVMSARTPNQSQMIGIFWSNASDTFLDSITISNPDTRLTHWVSEGGHLQFFLYAGASPNVVFYKQHLLTGFAPVPANWVLGYHQCKWNYYTQEETEEVSDNFLKYKIPCDSIWLDIEHTDAKKVFTWNKEMFPDPQAMLDTLVKQGARRLILIVDPHIKVDPDFLVYQGVSQKNLAVRNSENAEFIGRCFPGDSVWMDFLNQECREYLKSLYVEKWKTNGDGEDKYYIFTDRNVHVWNDMNEPGVFAPTEQTMPKSNRHTLSIGSKSIDVEHRLVHSVYGFFNTMASNDALMARTEVPERPFVLSRSFFAGSQRFYTAVWTADCRCDWDHYRLTTKMLLTQSIGGMQLIGADIPGFYLNPPEEQIVVRWYQLGSMMPFFRAHGHRKTKRREPWLFSEETRKRLENIIVLRYQYLQYLSQVFFLHNKRGEPVLRPMWYNYPDQENVNNIDDQFMIGSDLIVKPVYEKDATTCKVWLPKGEVWYYAFLGEGFEGKGQEIDLPVTMDTFGLFVRAGTIIPMCKAADGEIRSSEDLKGKKFDLMIYLNKEGKAKGFMFLSDGYTTNYEKGEYTLHVLEYDGKQVKFTQIFGKEQDLAEMLDDIQIIA